MEDSWSAMLCDFQAHSSDSVTHTQASSLFQILFPLRFLHKIGQKFTVLYYIYGERGISDAYISWMRFGSLCLSRNLLPISCKFQQLLLHLLTSGGERCWHVPVALQHWGLCRDIIAQLRYCYVMSSLLFPLINLLKSLSALLITSKAQLLASVITVFLFSVSLSSALKESRTRHPDKAPRHTEYLQWKSLENGQKWKPSALQTLLPWKQEACERSLPAPGGRGTLLNSPLSSSHFFTGYCSKSQPSVSWILHKCVASLSRRWKSSLLQSCLRVSILLWMFPYTCRHSIKCSHFPPVDLYLCQFNFRLLVCPWCG